MPIKVDLFIIDPQDDFCDPSGALYVKGAEDDMARVAKMIDRIGDKVNDIHVTLDSHHAMDVAHPIYWKDSKGNHPAPFTIITAKDVENGVWTPSVVSWYRRALDYVKNLEKNKRYPLCIWPPHCLIGSKGARVIPVLFEALLKWENRTPAMVNYVTKGSNPHTEHYSGLRADVVDPADITTQLNADLIETLENVDIIAIMGEASSHCVANTVRDLIAGFTNADCAKKIVIIRNGMSPVTGFEKLQDDFFAEMQALGVKFATTDDFLA